LGYLEGRSIKPVKSIELAPATSIFIEPKSARRIILSGNHTFIPNDVVNYQVEVNEPVSIQLQTNFNGENNISNIVAIVRNNNCQPQCLLAQNTLLTLTDTNKQMTSKVSEITHKISDTIDLNEADLNHVQKQSVRNMLDHFRDVFAEDLSEIGCTNLMTYDIRLKPNAHPIRMRPYKTGWKQREIIEDQVDEWVKNKIIRPSMSEWSFPCLLVAKKGTDKHRLCVDFRALNAQSELPNYPLIDLEEFLADLGNQKSNFYTTIDLKSAYLQVPLTERSQEMCSFVCSKGQYSFLRAPFGLCALPLVFARLIDEVLRGTKHKFTQSFIDDILIYSPTFELHLEHIKIVLQRLREAGLTVEPRKTFIARKEIVFIGYTFGRYGIRTDPTNIDKVKNFPTPKNVRDVRSFLGLSNYYRRFIKSYADTARPLNELLKKKSNFEWTKEANVAFETLREHLITSPILAFPDLSSDEPLRLTCDASLFGSGYVLSQYQPDMVAGGLTERVISYGSRNFTEVQQRYTVTERELLAVVFAVGKLDQYLRCKKFLIITDHSSLQWLLSKSLSNINARLARWVLGLGQYNFTIIHKAGISIGHADCLSRQRYDNAQEDISFVVDPCMNILAGNQEHKIDKQLTNTPVTEMMLPGLERFSLENLRHAQMNDYWYGALKKYIITNELPSSKKLSQRIIADHQDYIIVNGILYHVWIGKGKHTEPVQQICVTEEFKELIWKAMHALPQAGHLGVTKTYTKVRNRYFWPKMSAETMSYVQQCEVCARANKGQGAKIPLQPLPVPTGPLERIHIDILSISVPSQGAKYILVIICAFSKYVIARPLKKKTSRSVAKAFFQHYILLFGLPAQAYLTVTQDNGGEFVGNFNKTLQHMLGIKSSFITPYSPASNGMVEKANRTLLSILRRYAMKEANKWAHYLPYAAMAINSACSETTGSSPFELLHGVVMREAIDLQITKPATFVAKEQETAHRYWTTHLGKIRSLARDQIFKAKSAQKKQYDRYAKPMDCKLGDTVYLKRSAVGLTEDPKLRPMYSGPYEIHRFVSPTNVLLKDSTTNIQLPRSYHINKLKKMKRKKRLENHPNVQKNATEGYHNDKAVDPTTQQTPGMSWDVQPRQFGGQEISKFSNRSLMGTPIRSGDQLIEERNDAEHEDDVITDHTEDSEMKDTGVDEQEEGQTTYSTQESMIANAPTEEFSSEMVEEHINKEREVYYPIKKVHRKRITCEGDKEYYVSWKNRPKRDNCWIAEDQFSNELREKVDSLKIPMAQSN